MAMLFLQDTTKFWYNEVDLKGRWLVVYKEIILLKF